MKGAGILMLLLAFLLVAMPVAATSFADVNGALSASVLQTKIMGEEEVGAPMVLAENVTAPSVGTEALAFLIILVSGGLGLLLSRSRFRSKSLSAARLGWFRYH